MSAAAAVCGCMCGCVCRSGTLHVSPVSVTVPSWGTSVRREGDTVTLDRPVTVTVVPASQAAHAGRNIASYTLTWGRSFLKPLHGGDAASGGGVLPHVFDATEVDAGEHGASHLHFVLPEGTRVPSEATHLLACVSGHVWAYLRLLSPTVTLCSMRGVSQVCEQRGRCPVDQACERVHRHTPVALQSDTCRNGGLRYATWHHSYHSYRSGGRLGPAVPCQGRRH